jgi:hypothetical protein
VTHVTDRGGGYGGGWGESQDEFKRRVMGKKRDFSVTSCISFISSHRRKLVALTCLAIPCGSEFYQNITDPTTQQKPAIERSQESMKRSINAVEGVVTHPVSVCFIVGFIENHKTSHVWQCVMDALQNQSR